MSCLPSHGRVSCSLCYNDSSLQFDISKQTSKDNDWRITANPLSWGSTEPEIIVLGFSKGPTQSGALTHTPHNQIAYKGSRKNVGKILAHIGLIPKNDPDKQKLYVDRMIENKAGRFHFASLIRCTVERYDQKTASWKGSGGGMLDNFIATPFGKDVATQCVKKFLGNLAPQTRLIVMFGLGTKLNYVKSSYELFELTRPGNWKVINKVAYTDGKITVVHVEHFASQGKLIPNWLGVNDDPRSEYGRYAIEAVKSSGCVLY